MYFTAYVEDENQGHPIWRYWLHAVDLEDPSKPEHFDGPVEIGPLSGDCQPFGVSPFAPGVVAFSRILNNQEVVVVANADSTSSHAVYVIVDSSINAAGAPFQTLYSNNPASQSPGSVQELGQGTVTIHEVDRTTTNGPVHVIKVKLQPMEAQILKKQDS